MEFKEKATLTEDARRKITGHFLKHLTKLSSPGVIPAIISEIVKQDQRPKYA